MAGKSMEEMVKEATGFELADLKAAFEGVQNQENWKMPIACIIEASRKEIVAAAIEFYTGSKAEFTELDYAKGFVAVKAAGYYIAVGA